MLLQVGFQKTLKLLTLQEKSLLSIEYFQECISLEMFELPTKFTEGLYFARKCLNYQHIIFLWESINY